MLATCMEYIRAIDSPHPEAYLSNIPVHQVRQEMSVECRMEAATDCSITPRWDSTKPAERRSIWSRVPSLAMCIPRFYAS